jgi:hypothetical protein
MTEAKNNFVHWAHQRKAELASHIFGVTAGRVHRGPFAGMKIYPEYRASDNPVGKLMGLYECEIFPAIEEVIEWEPDVVLNVGAGEGFYAFGYALKTQAHAVLVDLDQSAFSMAEKNAQLNGITNYTFSTDSSVDNFQSILSKYERPHVFMDCEGYEDQLLDPVALPALLKSAIIVESHDCFRPGITPKLIDRFITTHTIQVINQGAKNPYQDIVYDLDDFDKMLMCVEGRPSTATWLYMSPRNKVVSTARNRNSYYINY